MQSAGREAVRTFQPGGPATQPRRPDALRGPTDMLVTLEGKLYRLWGPKSRQPCANRPALDCLRDLTWGPPHSSPRFVSTNLSPHTNTRGQSDLLSWTTLWVSGRGKELTGPSGELLTVFVQRQNSPDGSRVCPWGGPPMRAVQTGGGSWLGPLEQRWGWGGGAWGPPPLGTPVREAGAHIVRSGCGGRVPALSRAAQRKPERSLVSVTPPVNAFR